jgi:hypothetical protein
MSPRKKRNLWGWEFIKSALPGILAKGMIQETPLYLAVGAALMAAYPRRQRR